MQVSRNAVFGIFFSIVVGAAGGLAAADLDLGSEVPPGTAGSTNRDVMCLSPYYFGGNTDSFSGTDRLRGNFYTFTAADTLTEITVELKLEEGESLESVIQQLKELGVEVLSYDEETGRIQLGPAEAPKLAPKLASLLGREP